MTIQCYSVSCDKKRVDKTNYFNPEHPAVTLTNVRFKDDVDILNPVLYVDHNADLFGCNYVHIGTLHRFYFIKNVTTAQPGLYLELHEDVLMSYLSEIKEMSGIIERQENSFDMYLNDKVFKTDNYSIDYTVDFPNTGNFFTNQAPSFVLAVAGPKGGVT